MISSTAFPNVTFIRAPIVSPSLQATASVACDSMPARGMMAMAFNANTTVGLMRVKLAAIPAGTNTKSTFIQLESNVSLKVV